MFDKKRRINTPFANINYPNVKYDPACNKQRWDFRYLHFGAGEQFFLLAQSWFVEKFRSRVWFHWPPVDDLCNCNSSLNFVAQKIKKQIFDGHFNSARFDSAITRRHLRRSPQRNANWPSSALLRLLRFAFRSRDVKQIWNIDDCFYVFHTSRLLRSLVFWWPKNYANRSKISSASSLIIEATGEVELDKLLMFGICLRGRRKSCNAACNLAMLNRYQWLFAFMNWIITSRAVI